MYVSSLFCVKLSSFTISDSKENFNSRCFIISDSFFIFLSSIRSINLDCFSPSFSNNFISSSNSFCENPRPVDLLYPPIIAPEGSNKVPSKVTILILPIPIFLATSILSTTRVDPNTYEKTLLNLGSY